MRLGAQEDLVAAWQLRAAGWSRDRVHHWSSKEAWRRIHDGVWALGQAPLTQRQRWIAAVLTAPGTHLAGRSACWCHGFIEWTGGYETVVRAGSGGRRRYPGSPRDPLHHARRADDAEGRDPDRDCGAGP